MAGHSIKISTETYTHVVLAMSAARRTTSTPGSRASLGRELLGTCNPIELSLTVCPKDAVA
jgi:hypothetical protein